jgi:hypothetical protein
MYKCSHCDRVFSRKDGLERHLNKKNKCYKKDTENNNLDTKYIELQNKFLKMEEILYDLLLDKAKQSKDNATENANNSNNQNSTISNAVNSTVNSTINSNNSNNVMFNFQHIDKNFNTAKNLEDVMRIDNVTEEIYKTCHNKYINNGATHIFRTLCVDDIDLEERSIHCLDSSRRNYAVRTKNTWKRDCGGSIARSICQPVIKKVYKNITKKLLCDDKYSPQTLTKMMVEQASYGDNDDFNKTLDEVASDLVPQNNIKKEQQIDKKIENLIENNIYTQFMKTKTKKSTTHIHTKDLYDHFRNWYLDTISKENIPSSAVFIKNVRMNHLFYKSVKINNKVSSGLKNLSLC